jgi:hypothetical protein
MTAREQLLHRRRQANNLGVDGVYYEYDVIFVPSSGR